MIFIGKYKEIYNNSELPSILDCISDTPCDNKDTVLKYLKSGKITSYAPGIPVDLISGKNINIELCCLNDGKYVWRSDIIYYFEKYNLKLPEDFIQHVLNAK